MALEKVEGIDAAYIYKEVELFLSKDLEISADMLNGILSDAELKVKVSDPVKNPKVTF